MNCKIPFTKDIDFEKTLYEITSISLEHEIKVEEGTLKGNFILTGDFKSHELSVNKEPFSYILPFEIAINDDIDEKTIEFMIEDFTYEVKESNILHINIDFNVIGSKKEEEEKIESKEEDPNRIFKDASDLFPPDELPIYEESTSSLTNEEPRHEENNVLEEVSVDSLEQTKQEETKTTTTKINEDTIIDNLNGTLDDYTTYHIHMVSDGETVETICTMYNTNMSILSEYNDLSELTSGDKLIIPEANE